MTAMSTLETYKGTKRKKAKVKVKRGSQRYLHLLNFIERRREKKREKRRTLDATAQVIFRSKKRSLHYDAVKLLSIYIRN